jgi:spermidine synthase
MSIPILSRKNLLHVLGCFFLSGAAGLIYQVAWVKSLGLIFGHTVYAIAIVLAVFMAGLTAGSAWFGRRAEQHSDRVVLYSRIEFLVAATGALSLAGLAAVRWLYVLTYPSTTGLQWLVLAMRFLGSAVVLFVPTFLMGGTLPILVRAVTSTSADLGVRVSQLYWVNTLGAVAGTLLSGFILLPAVGLRATVACAALLNVVAGLIARKISQQNTAPSPTKTEREISSPTSTDRPLRSPNFLLFLFAAVGATAFAYEIAWTRLLSITISSSTYAFTLMLATFLAGAVLGSAFFQRYFVSHPASHSATRRRDISISTFSSTQTWTGIAALISLILFHWIPSFIPPLLRATHNAFSGLLLAQLLTTALTVLPVAIIFGFNFPTLIVLLNGTSSENSADSTVSDNSKTVGEAYAANTAGAIVGSLLTGFCLVPWLGAFRTVAAAAGINLLLAVVLEFATPKRRLFPVALNAAFIAVAFLIATSSFFNNPSLLSLSAVLYGNSFQGLLNLNEVAATNELVFAADGANDSVSVFRSDNYVALRINGKVDASTGDARTQLLLGHLGAAFDPAPRRVLIIGFGSGMTASAVSRYPGVERVDCVEIEPAVLRAAPYLASLNRYVLSDPRVHIIFDDARNFLLTSREKYDLIISEPSNPWIAGIATLFTSEFYSAVRQQLNPAGKFVQWVQSYALAPADLRMIIGTLAAHFPELTLWRGEGPDLLLLARTETAPLQFTGLRSLWHEQALRDDFASIDVHQPGGLIAYFLLDDAALRKLAQGSTINTDDHTLLEYHAPKTVLQPDLSNTNRELIAKFRTSPLPANLAPTEIPQALEAGAASALNLGDLANAQNLLRLMESQPPSATRDLLEGRLAYLQSRFGDAESYLRSAIKQAPDQLEAMHWLAVVAHHQGNDAEARALVDEILEKHPRYLPALTDEMQFAADRQDYRIALIAQLNRMKVLPGPPAPEYCRLGAIWMKLGNPGEAEPVLQKGILIDPYSYSCNLELGELYREAGRYAEARRHLELVIRLYPNYDATTFRTLAGVQIIMGDRHAAQATLRKGQRLFPSDADLQREIPN